MKIICLDLEGVLVPEMWIAFADTAGIPALRRTTRDEPDYDKLMKGRIAILKEHGLGLAEIQRVIATVEPM
ncbi:MAG: bifunctional phosphoserine phosphatase/homoserine phosphotransferase ThrH, partial [Clostridia bacterium]|nr:bifunctional phosphoserine phosphatase/homoserine phosphotransferase ThrH [Clostridia bacterium]